MGREEGSGWGTHVYLWWIHFDIWQNQYNIVKFKNKIKLKKKKTTKGTCLTQQTELCTDSFWGLGPIQSTDSRTSDTKLGLKQLHTQGLCT